MASIHPCLVHWSWMPVFLHIHGERRFSTPKDQCNIKSSNGALHGANTGQRFQALRTGTRPSTAILRDHHQACADRVDRTTHLPAPSANSQVGPAARRSAPHVGRYRPPHPRLVRPNLHRRYPPPHRAQRPPPRARVVLRPQVPEVPRLRLRDGALRGARVSAGGGCAGARGAPGRGTRRAAARPPSAAPGSCSGARTRTRWLGRASARTRGTGRATHKFCMLPLHSDSSPPPRAGRFHMREAADPPGSWFTPMMASFVMMVYVSFVWGPREARQETDEGCAPCS